MRLVWRPITVWPGELSKSRERAPWAVNEDKLWADLQREVEHLDPVFPEVVLETAADERDMTVNGTLKRNAVLRHPGVIVAFESARVGPLRLACDRYWARTDGAWNGNDVRANVRAVSLTLERLRAVERYGVGTGREQYQGWKALGPGTIELGPHRMSEMEARQMFRATIGDFARTDDPAEMFRIAAKSHHPDAGGDEATFKLLVEARDVLLRAAMR